MRRDFSLRGVFCNFSLNRILGGMTIFSSIRFRLRHTNDCKKSTIQLSISLGVADANLSFNWLLSPVQRVDTTEISNHFSMISPIIPKKRTLPPAGLSLTAHDRSRPFPRPSEHILGNPQERAPGANGQFPNSHS
jgi:hypothetical protein